MYYDLKIKYLYLISKCKYKVKQLLSFIIFRKKLVIFICTIFIFIICYYKEITQIINITSFKELIININHIFSDYSYVISAAILIILFIISFLTYSSHKSSFNKVISDFQYDELFSILKYHRDLADIISCIILKNKENMEHLLGSFQKDNQTEQNRLAKKLVETKFQHYTLDISHATPIVKHKKQTDYYMESIAENNNYVCNNISNELKALCEILTKYNDDKTYYSLNVFTQYKRGACFPYDLLRLRSQQDIQAKIFSKFLSNQLFKTVMESIDSDCISESIIKARMTEQYLSVKFRLEWIIIDSIDLTVQLECYQKNIDKILNIRKRKLAKGISKAIEIQKS